MPILEVDCIQRIQQYRNVNAIETIEGLAALLASPPRRRMLEVLLDGNPRSATELAIISSVAFNTASTHLGRLVQAGLVSFERSGRHRFYRVSEPRITDVIETLYESLPSLKKPPVRTLTEIEFARSCYDHVAGRLGSSLTRAMISQGYLTSHEKEFRLSEEGESFCSRLGIDLEAVRRQRRMFARRCLDWTDKRDHLGGALGAALTKHYFALEWLRPGSRPRLVRITPRGAKAFQEHFGLAREWEGLQSRLSSGRS